MANELHTISVAAASSPLAQADRIIMVLQKSMANVAGSAAGASVALALTGLNLPAAYAVFVSPDQDATHWISGRTQTGLTINLSPRLAASTLATGKVDILILA